MDEGRGDVTEALRWEGRRWAEVRRDGGTGPALGR